MLLKTVSTERLFALDVSNLTIGVPNKYEPFVTGRLRVLIIFMDMFLSVIYA